MDEETFIKTLQTGILPENFFPSDHPLAILNGKNLRCIGPDALFEIATKLFGFAETCQNPHDKMLYEATALSLQNVGQLRQRLMIPDGMSTDEFVLRGGTSTPPTLQ